MVVKKYLKFIWEYFKINLQSAMEYRTSFIIQSLFMFLNDVIWVLFWIIFFTKFPSINTWDFKDLMVLYVILSSSWGLVGIFFGNFKYIAEIIRDGQLDFYLSLPKEELTHLLISRAKFDAFGDLIFGILLACIFIPFHLIPLTIILIMLSALILLAFAIILGSFSFYFGSAVEVANQGLMGVLSFGSYPFTAFNGVARFILLTLIPAGFITGIPVELIKNFDLKWFLFMILAVICLWLIALSLFKKGVRQYESGNLINARV